jgi:hypothetical protein
LQLEALRARTTLLFHGEVNAGDVLYQPIGTWIVERSVDNNRCFGMRVSVMPRVAEDSPPAKGLTALIACAATGGAENAELSKFLGALKSAMTAAAVIAAV